MRCSNTNSSQRDHRYSSPKASLIDHDTEQIDHPDLPTFPMVDADPKQIVSSKLLSIPAAAQ